MQPIEPPDSHHVMAAQGWLELGNFAEAALELERVSVPTREHPSVLDLRWQLHAKAKQWQQALALAEDLCRSIPESPFAWIHRSYCLHELGRTQEAWDALQPMATRFPEEWLIGYNLACYACQLGHLDEAKAWLDRARLVGDSRHVDRLAAADADLKPLFLRG
jgi:predicted Zn-dependent protease